jgi:16S rRNA (uracil1498-N3)-methyltransferase
LRFPEGKNITLFNGDGMNYSTQVLQAKKDCRVKILEKTQDFTRKKQLINLNFELAPNNSVIMLPTKNYVDRSKTKST